jgi:hypothetical protein
VAEVERIQDQLDRSFRGPAWHGPSLMELLRGVDATRAARRPLPHAHSIWEITLHVSVWEDVVRRRIEGEAVEPSGEQDWPPVRDTGERVAGRARRAGARARGTAGDRGSPRR